MKETYMLFFIFQDDLMKSKIYIFFLLEKFFNFFSHNQINVSKH